MPSTFTGVTAVVVRYAGVYLALPRSDDNHDKLRQVVEEMIASGELIRVAEDTGQGGGLAFELGSIELSISDETNNTSLVKTILEGILMDRLKTLARALT